MAETKPPHECCCKAGAPASDAGCGNVVAEAATHAAHGTAPWILGTTSLGDVAVPTIATTLRPADHLGAWRVRWAIDRMGYRVAPGLYAVGAPTPESAVLVSANYKLSFDRLRSQLSTHDAWILVLDTQGVNVWCAAGKGTFGTEELVRRIEQYALVERIAHRTVIVPQLAAPGVAAHEVRKRTGVRVVYGPVRAENLPAFLAAGMKATPEMRRVRFPLRDRVAVIPVELVNLAKWLLLLASLLLVLGGLGRDGYALGRVVEIGMPSAAMFVLTSLGGLVLGPALLPWLPGRPFSLKGFWIGLALLVLFFTWGRFSGVVFQNWATAAGWCLLLPSVSSVLVMSFTGASTYTSLSGVRRETRVALPLLLVAFLVGLGAWLLGRFL